MTKYSVKILLKDDKIACCSQMCTENCPNYDTCEPAIISIDTPKEEVSQDIRKRVEKLYK